MGAEVKLLVAFSGGKDSTAMLYGMVERGERPTALFTPTGNELPPVQKHVEETCRLLDVPLVIPKGGKTLEFWIHDFQALPNWRQRWCTRLIKIVPCIAYLQRHPGSTLCVGLRADEEAREGLYGEYARYRYPLREWGWDITKVRAYLSAREITVPPRTDCALCYGQRLTEWYMLWKEWPEYYKHGEELEARYGHTFRSPGRDTWPASLAELRQRFERGDIPRARGRHDACSVCLK